MTIKIILENANQNHESYGYLLYKFNFTLKKSVRVKHKKILTNKYMSANIIKTSIYLFGSSYP